MSKEELKKIEDITEVKELEKTKNELEEKLAGLSVHKHRAKTYIKLARIEMQLKKLKEGSSNASMIEFSTAIAYTEELEGEINKIVSSLIPILEKSSTLQDKKEKINEWKRYLRKFKNEDDFFQNNDTGIGKNNTVAKLLIPKFYEMDKELDEIFFKQFIMIDNFRDLC
ncbi:hypothetical protein MWH28_07225 [Natroniella sulfidigena]|uniref:hypothetical protein n=1 Tax=Natroniella sulfidigena TaxID=723921 RepID=UPI00200A365A|nr:hypothetical protein [Natroniella sulfidigena]MCK8817150.1 hypothetical protein [Natroniella sulfidigena]